MKGCRRWIVAALAGALLGGCGEEGGPGEEHEALPPGTVPVPGAAAPGSAPDPMPGTPRADEAYPGTVEPGVGPADVGAGPAPRDTLPARGAPPPR